MYKKVETPEDVEYFNGIWMECWQEKGYDFEINPHHTARFLIKDPSDVWVGTVEIQPYSLDGELEVNQAYPFNHKPLLLEDMFQTIIIDKVAILKEYRGKNLNTLLSVIIHHAELHSQKYCVALLERVFYKALRNVYKVPFEIIGEMRFYKGDYVIPSVINLQTIYSNKEQFDWLVDISEAYGIYK
ncbi:hypothetical protein LCM10_09590 [Rossellomorea aquimaris]|uniref:hypothetical protein n=1 Tax=Rossellomorea aquimaris TaxID=189382 RepID=UPI001CD77AE2|nr:hypothetical protein [Rossellomorea aquimaris]MCA1055235.1 hypothetical protein [Rossellomorea aquimaris]